MDCLLLVLADPPLPPPLFPEGLPWPPPRRRVRRTSFPVPRVAHRLTFPRASSSLPRNMFSLPDLCLADEKRARVVYETFCWDAPRLSGVSRNETLRIRRPTWATDRIFSPLWGGGGSRRGRERYVRTHIVDTFPFWLAGAGDVPGEHRCDRLSLSPPRRILSLLPPIFCLLVRIPGVLFFLRLLSSSLRLSFHFTFSLLL